MRRGRWGLALLILGALGEERFRRFAEPHTSRWGDVVNQTAGWVNAKTGEIAFLRRPVAWEIRDRTDLEEIDEESHTVAVSVSYPRGDPDRAGGASKPNGQMTSSA